VRGHWLLNHSGSCSSFPVKEQKLVPALPAYLIEPIWEQFWALLPERETNHPLGCHRPRISDRTVFEKLVRVLVFGCAYERIADELCSATTLRRRRRDEWIEAGVMAALRKSALEAYDKLIGLRLSDLAVDCCITKAPCGGRKAGRSPVDRGKRGASNAPRSWTDGASRSELWQHRPIATTPRFWSKPWTPPWRCRDHCPIG
jgi:transposase